jgi:hypothetical protein
MAVDQVTSATVSATLIVQGFVGFLDVSGFLDLSSLLAPAAAFARFTRISSLCAPFPRSKTRQDITSPREVQRGVACRSCPAVAVLFNNPTYGTIFSTFSPLRLFTPVGSNIPEALFFIPGTNGATQQLWGALVRFSQTLTSRMGAGLFDDARIARVRITTGDVASGPDDDDGKWHCGDGWLIAVSLPPTTCLICTFVGMRHDKKPSEAVRETWALIIDDWVAGIRRPLIHAQVSEVVATSLKSANAPCVW